MASVTRQEEIQRRIESMLTNFKKDSIERKRNPEYFRKRLDEVSELWREFRENHEEIGLLENPSHPYYENRTYDKTKQLYLTFGSALNEGFKRITEGTTSAEGEPIFSTPRKTYEQQEPQQLHLENPQFKTETGTSSKLDEMFRKQWANMKAFVRTVNNIELITLTDKWELEDALKSLQARWSVIDLQHWELESENTQTNVEYEATFNKHEKTFNNLKKEINRKIWSVAHREKSTPLLEIPIFHGNYNTWVSFKDLFCEAIHKNTALSNAQKMQFLKSKVKGEAERLIQHLQISSDNYLACWKILNDRYNNCKLIFTSHMNVLFALPNMQQQSVAQIKKIHDTTNECLCAIKNLGIDITTWDPIIVYILSQKLDPETHKEYIESLKNARELPILQDFMAFMEGKFTSLESSRRKQEPVAQKTFLPPTSTTNMRKHFQQNRPYANTYTNNGVNRSHSTTIAKTFHVSGIKCPLCNNQHGIYNCRQFLQMPVEKRYLTVKKLALCVNCLFTHHGNNCNSTKTCHKCAGQHNTLIHEACVKPIASAPQASTSNATSNAAISGKQKDVTNISQTPDDFSEILLATAQIKVKGADGTYHILRALIDQGSQISLITEQAAQTLNLKRQRCNGVIYGVGQKQNNCKGKLNIQCESTYSDFTFHAEVIIMNNLIKHLPNKTFTKPSWRVIENISLADPEFYVSRPIDLLLGADIYQQILLNGIIRGEDSSQPLAQQTRIGWLLSGNARTYHCNVVINNLEDIKQFWEIEEIAEEGELSREDQECIKHYQENTKRNSDGRYEVRLPMKPKYEEQLGESKTKAIAQFKNMERKLQRQEKLAEAYKTFMDEYRDLGHMKPAKSDGNIECYLPHHIVERTESTTTKYRVVFNASSKTTTKLSLNDLMYTGPNLQQDLQVLLLKWRQYQYAYTADVEKMYRQILINEADQQLQKIIWRESPETPLTSFQLATLSYGMKPAPFLAMMTLKRLAADERDNFPEAAKVVEEAFYMDDLVHGAHSVEQGKKLINDLNDLLKSGGFNLRKWSANNENILENINRKQDSGEMIFNFKVDNITKTLGLCWNPTEDSFRFKYNTTQSSGKPTKRTLLSEISKLYDPLGFLAPFVTKLKLLFQKVWKENTQWDEQVSDEIYAEWLKAKIDSEQINECKIPRWILCKQNDVIELHGFCDASIAAYGCVVYARIKHQTEIALVAAKTKLVPHKSHEKTLTLARLELSGAHLLSRLIKKIKHSLQEREIITFGWTDSQIVLGWLHGEPSRWKPFVANRVEQIKQIMPDSQWRYVKSSENPADAASRGLTASELKDHALWWKAPSWLGTFQPAPENSKHYSTQEEEKKSHSNINKNTLVCTTQSVKHDNIINNLLDNYSSLSFIIRIVAWLFRALTPTPKRKTLPTYLTLPELRKAKLTIIKCVQTDELGTDIEYLRKYNKVETKSSLIKLKPFIDENNILRVGGRLKEAHISYEMKHPQIIPKESRFTTLLIEQAHTLTLHGGARMTLGKLREQYWVMGGMNRIKNQVAKCIKCKKIEGKKQPQLMGSLPAARVNEATPFYHTGVDYTGFVNIKANKGRGIKTLKGYIALFICMVTKAVHLELVTDLTSSAFLAALRRMAARKGKPKHMYSDQGTNFVRANKDLQKHWQELSNIFNDSFLTEITEMEIEWHFNAPAWPSAGGLWERAVSSLKHHLKRVIGDQNLTYEEYATILAQIEACLNSRPLCPLTEDIEDLNFITPAHFLTCRAGVTIIETEEDARTRWHLTQKIFRDIWKRWKVEYLSQLTVRPKWNKSQRNIEKDDLVVIHEDNLPAGKWAMGRVLEVHPGQDGYVRVVTLKTKNGILKRPVVKLSVLPLPKEPQQKEKQSVTPEPQTSKSKQNKNTGCVSSIIMLLLYFMSLLTMGYSLKVTPVNEKQGLYFDRMGNMLLVKDEWKLIAYHDMNPYWEGISTYQKYNNQLEEICKQVRTLTHCDIIILQLRHSYDELQHYNRVLLGQQLKQDTRRRRGLINGIGNIAHSLFGVLDDKFAEQYQKDIELVRENEKHLATLWKNQTSVIEAEYNMLLRTKDNIQKQHKMIHAHLVSLERGTSALQKEVTQAECMAQFTIVAVAANNLLGHLRTIQDTLLDTLTNIYNGKMNIHIIDPQQFQRELNTISGRLENDLSLPIDNIQTHLQNIYHLLNIKARITDQYMIIEIRIPLISRDTYDLYNIIPTLHSVGRNMQSITPIEKYVAINLRKDSYLPITEKEMEHCTLRDPTAYMCFLRTPVYKMNSDEDLCLKDEHFQCKTNTVACQNTWRSLSRTNQYLYFCCETCQLRTLCKSQVTAQTLTQTNIIMIEETCVVKTDNFTINTHKNMESRINLNFNIEAPEIDPINHIINISMPEIKMIVLIIPTTKNN